MQTWNKQTKKVVPCLSQVSTLTKTIFAFKVRDWSWFEENDCSWKLELTVVSEFSKQVLVFCSWNSKGNIRGGQKLKRTFLWKTFQKKAWSFFVEKFFWKGNEIQHYQLMALSHWRDMVIVLVHQSSGLCCYIALPREKWFAQNCCAQVCWFCVTWGVRSIWNF